MSVTPVGDGIMRRASRFAAVPPASGELPDVGTAAAGGPAGRTGRISGSGFGVDKTGRIPHSFVKISME